MGWEEFRQGRLPRLTSRPQVSLLRPVWVSEQTLVSARCGSRAGGQSLSLQSFPLDLANEQDTPYTSPREGSDHHPSTREAQCRLQVSVPMEGSAHWE